MVTESNQVSYNEWKEAIFNAESVDSKQALFLIALGSRCDYDTGTNAHQSMETVAKRAKMTSKTARKYRDWALEAGWIVQTGTKEGNIAVFSLSLPTEQFGNSLTDLNTEQFGNSSTDLNGEQFGNSLTDLNDDGPSFSSVTVTDLIPYVVDSSSVKRESSSVKLTDQFGNSLTDNIIDTTKETTRRGDAAPEEVTMNKDDSNQPTNPFAPDTSGTDDIEDDWEESPIEWISDEEWNSWSKYDQNDYIEFLNGMDEEQFDKWRAAEEYWMLATRNYGWPVKVRNMIKSRYEKHINDGNDFEAAFTMARGALA